MIIVKRILFPRQLSPRPRCQQVRPSNVRIITCDPISRAEPVLPQTRKRVRTRRTATMNDLDIPLVVPFLFFFSEKKLIILQSRMKSGGCQLEDAQTSC